MKVFHCDHCDRLVFFENTQCVACGHTLAFLPDVMEIGSLEPSGDAWASPLPAARGRIYRLCQNYLQHGVCNWAVADDGDALCEACRLTRVIPDLAAPGTLDAWARLELAKRRVVYTLKNLGLPTTPRVDNGSPGLPPPPRLRRTTEASREGGQTRGTGHQGLEFQFLADDPSGGAPVLTGHDSGTITVNIAEADDAERERRRCALGEPYRTLLGHLRHETGHYYWERLVGDPETLERFRWLFGDERDDYGTALGRYYAAGPPADWRDRFVSAYAGAHPWEDWAETWTHYLHMTDTLETAEACGMSIRPKRQGEPSLTRLPESAGTPESPFHRLIGAWLSVTYVLNNLNRGMGLADAYPFVLSPTAIEKLRFVHEVVARSAERAGRGTL